jgi:4-hydroxybenzoate polyprenyltransferase
MIFHVKGLSKFISIERGIMLFMISMGATLLIQEKVALLQAVYFGVIGFCGWSGVDSINNICDVDLDVKSDPDRAEYTKYLGRRGFYIFLFFAGLTTSLGLITKIPLVTFFIALGILVGILYSVPPIRLRQTIFKPVVNFSVGAIPVLSVAALYNVFSLDVIALVVLIGVTTAVNSLWEDLADYVSDFESHARTIPILMGFKRGFYLTILLGYLLVPLMIVVGVLFQLSVLYYAILSILVSYITLRVIQKLVLQKTFNDSQTSMIALGETFAKDFALMAIIQTTNLMVNSYLKNQLFFLF